MSDKYRINPDFVVPDPTAANMFGFCKLDEFGDAEMKRQGDWMRAAGAKQMRVTVVSDEYPNDPYPHGYWFEGWTDQIARQIPFGEAEKPGGAIWPPLTYENGKLASGTEAQRATTVKQGVVHDGPVAKPDAQPQVPSP